MINFQETNWKKMKIFSKLHRNVFEIHYTPKFVIPNPIHKYYRCIFCSVPHVVLQKWTVILAQIVEHIRFCLNFYVHETSVKYLWLDKIKYWRYVTCGIHIINEYKWSCINEYFERNKLKVEFLMVIQYRVIRFCRSKIKLFFFCFSDLNRE